MASALSSCDQGCRVEAVVTVDSKGQLLLPKDLREKAGLKPNSKIALLTIEKEGKIQCILMINAERLSGAVNNVLKLSPKDDAK